MRELKENWKYAPTLPKIIFWVLLVACFIVFVIALIEPPEWEVYDNVLKGLAMFMGFASFGVGIDCLEKGMEIKFEKGDMSIDINKKDEDNGNK